MSNYFKESLVKNESTIFFSLKPESGLTYILDMFENIDSRSLHKIIGYLKGVFFFNFNLKLINFFSEMWHPC
jgi:hypothetical protein